LRDVAADTDAFRVACPHLVLDPALVQHIHVPPASLPVPYSALFRSVAEAPHLDLDSVTTGDQHPGTASGNEDTPIALDIATSLSERNPAPVISVTITRSPTASTFSADTDNVCRAWQPHPATPPRPTL